jgi:predicted TIM-barrel fold metal-dependent hydrolase
VAVWERLNALHRPPALRLSGGERRVREAGEVRQLLDMFPRLDVVIPHIGRPGKAPDTTWQERVLLAKHERVHLDLAALPVAFNAEGNPYPSGRAAPRWSIDQVGADKMMWGSG